MSVISTTRPTSRCLPWSRPNSCACFTALIMSLPALASATTSAPEACAASSEVENSCVLSGFFTVPSTRPPAFNTIADVSVTSPAPNA